MYKNRNRHFSKAEEAILTTLSYSDIFSFTPTKDELWQFLISDQPIPKSAFEEACRRLAPEYIVLQNKYYCLRGKETLIAERHQKKRYVTQKMVLAHSVIEKLSNIPTILFIGLSGGLAVGDADEKADIDLFVIARKNTLFTTRFMILILLQLLGRRRKRGDRAGENMVCVNFLIDETELAWRKNKQDVYTAREIAQLLPMFERGTTYTKFLQANDWITTYLPNSLSKKRRAFIHKSLKKRPFSTGLLERFLRFIQISYMKRAVTTEIITNHYLAFHPKDYGSETLKKLRLKMQSLGLLTKP